MEKRYLFTPGPTPVPPEVLAAGAEPMVHHRGSTSARCTSTLERSSRSSAPRAGAALQRVRHRARWSRGREPRRPGRQGRRRRAGAFGERWVEICEQYGLDVHRIDYAWGEVPSPDEIGAAVAESGAGMVFCTQSETSTGVVADVQAHQSRRRRRDRRGRRSLVARRGAARDRRVGDRRRRLGLAEGADVPAGPRDGERGGAALGHAAAVAQLLLRLARDAEGAARRSTRRSRRPCR